MSLPSGLGATYRVQLRPGFGFVDAARQVPYLTALGIETLYCSPVAEAVPGSAHGYDGVDPTALRHELGGASGYGKLVASCEQHGIGICVDLVPNHLATWARGPWWRRLLAEGRHSEMGAVFDVDWDAGEGDARGKVALPVLDRPLDEALAAGAVRLGERDGRPMVEVGDVDLPVAGGTVRPGEDLFEVLTAQHYRLVDWHDPRDRNYRRFFDVDGLVGVRVEDPHVFDLTHALVVGLAAAGRLSAIRVDHVDGLREPTAYLRRLRAAAGVPVVVEKILTGVEELRPDWPVVGTTGYEVIDEIGGVLVDPDGLERLVAAGRRDGDRDVDALTVETRRLVAETSFPGEIERCARRLGVPANGLEDVVVRLPRYRTYLDGAEGEGSEAAVWRALDDGDPLRHEMIDAVLDPGRRGATLGVQQLTGAVMAKGVEDTAWYRLSGPLVFCEVGGDPARDRHLAPSLWHEWCARRAAGGPTGLVPGTTHDTKRALDVRCRLYALAELADAFGEGLARFRHALGAGPEDELDWETRVLAQLVLGVLPPLPDAPREAPRGQGAPAGFGDAGWPPGDALAQRLGDALRKGAREAKARSSWRDPDEAYEARLAELANAAVADAGALTRSSFGPLVDEVARLGAVASLSAVVLRHALPGVPDCYQGDEAWNLSLVDPDNRRPVDFGALADVLASLPGGPPGEPSAAPRAREPTALDGLRTGWRDGRVKMLVTCGGLAARRLAAEAMCPSGGYVPLSAAGPASDSVLAFARTPAGGGPGAASPGWVVAVVTRLAGRLAAPAGDLPAAASYAGTTITLPEGAPRQYVDAVTGDRVDAGDGVLSVGDALRHLPVALLVGRADGG